MARRCRWVRVRALVGVAGELVRRVDAVVAAWLDARPLAVLLLDGAGWLGEIWHRQVAAARARCGGPGRGVIAVVVSDKKGQA